MEESLLDYFSKTNEAPDATQRACLEAGQQKIKNSLAEVDIEISLLLSEYTRLRSAKFSIRACSSDILRQIFANFLPNGVEYAHRCAHVCKRWRKIIINTPSFWTKLVLPGGGHENDITFRQVWLQLCHYTNRAQDLPISLTINKLPSNLFDLLIDSIFGEVGGHWGSISMPPVRRGHIQQILSYYHAFPAEADYLTSLSFTTDGYDEEDEEDAEAFDLIGMCPMLELLHFDFSSLELIQERFIISCATPSSLTLRAEATSDQYLEILSECHSLQSLSIQPEDENEWEYGEEGDVVELAYLEKLWVKSSSHPTTLFERLSAPCLQELYLYVPNPLDDDNPAIQTFLDSMVSSGSLRLLHCYGHHDETIGFFDHQALRNLESLRLVGPYNTPDEDQSDNTLFDLLLAEDEDDGTRMPHLEVLEIQDYPKLSWKEMQALATLIRSRCRDGVGGRSGSLRCFNLGIQSSEGNILGPWDELDVFRRQGILVNSV